MNASDISIYHNPRCSKSRQTLQLIRDAGIEPKVVEYLKDCPSAAELDRLLKKLQLEPINLMRRGESVFKELDIAKRKLTRDKAIQLMVDNPVLIERPIVVKGDKAILGRPPENVEELL